MSEFSPVSRHREMLDNGDGTITYHQFMDEDPHYYKDETEQYLPLDIESIEDATGKTGEIKLRKQGFRSVGVRADGEKTKYLGIRPDVNQTLGTEQLEFTPEEMIFDKQVFPINITEPVAIDSTTDDCGDIVLKHHKIFNRQMVKVPIQADDFQVKFTLDLKGLKVSNTEITEQYEIRSAIPGGIQHKLGYTTAPIWNDLKEELLASNEFGILQGVFTDKTISVSTPMYEADISGLPEGYTAANIPDNSCRSWPNEGQFALSVYNAPVDRNEINEIVKKALEDLTGESIIIGPADTFIMNGKLIGGAVWTEGGRSYTVIVFLKDVSDFLSYYIEGKELAYPHQFLTDKTYEDLEAVFQPHLDKLISVDTQVISEAGSTYYQEGETGCFDITDQEGNFKFKILRPVLMDEQMEVMEAGTLHSLRLLNDGTYEYIKYPDPDAVLRGLTQAAAYVDAYTYYSNTSYFGHSSATTIPPAQNTDVFDAGRPAEVMVVNARNIIPGDKMTLDMPSQYRIQFPFNTSGLPDSGPIAAASLHFYQRPWTKDTANFNTFYDSTVVCYGGNYSLPPSGQKLANWNYTTGLGGSVACTNANGWKTLTLNSTGRNFISKTSWTKLILGDSTQGSIPGAETYRSAKMYSPTGSSPPYLSITLTAYSVTFAAGSGGSISGTTSQAITYGNNCSAVTAVPNANYKFVGWTGSVTSSSNPLTVTNVTGSQTITANFELDMLDVNFSVSGIGGTLSGDLNQIVQAYSDATSVAPTSLLHYRFAGWTGDHIGTENPLTLTNVTAPANVMAHFERIVKIFDLS